MKKAFTLIELVLVIVVIGILSTQISPNFNKDNLQEAANQLLSHIRYTQHLAMMDNQFDTNNANWFKGRWQLSFQKTVASEIIWGYSIFSDAGTFSGNPDLNELARNPINRQQRLTAGISGGVIPPRSKRSTKAMLLKDSFAIKDVRFVGCGSTARRIAFDMLGRPIIGNIKNATGSYTAGTNIGSPLRTTCMIELCTVASCSSASSEEVIKIVIEPETGYTHIL